MEEEKKVTEEVKENKPKKSTVSKKEYDELLEKFNLAMSTAAHHQDLSKYYQSEYEKLNKYRSQKALEALLPSIDSFEIAFKFKAPTEEAEKYKAGFEFVYKMMIQALESEGLSSFQPKVNDEFDSKTMQIVDTVVTEDEKLVNKVAELMLSGYNIKDRLLRPASVKVYIKKEDKDETIDENKEKLN